MSFLFVILFSFSIENDLLALNAPTDTTTDADNDDSDDDNLFGSDDDAEPKKTPAKKPAALSKRQRMDALQAKKRKAQQVVSGVPRGDDKQESGGNDEDSYNSAEYVRTKEDLDFIDTEGDDAEALAELYAEQNFDDERGEAMEEVPKKKKGGGSSSARSGRSERAILEAEGDQDNPLVQAVNKLKKKKKVKKTYSDWEEEAKPFLARMEQAAEEDEEAIQNKRPALKKLQMLQEVYDTIVIQDMQRALLDHDLLSICRRWIQPMKNGQLGNVTVRQKIVAAVALIKGNEDAEGITLSDLKRSEFGKCVMSLYMHKSETPAMKKQLKALIDQWSRPIFQKSSNMRDLERVHHSRGGTGVAAMNRQNFIEQQARERAALGSVHRGKGGEGQDLDSLIKAGSQGKMKTGITRVRVPFSKGFAYSVRPEDKATGDTDNRRAAVATTQDSRGKLSKRMVEKGRTKAKNNQRSANISIEGRGVK